MDTRQTKPMSNIQAELLKLYANNLDEKELMEIKVVLAKHFADKATEAMERVWEEKNLSEHDMDNWTNEHNRDQARH